MKDTAIERMEHDPGGKSREGSVRRMPGEPKVLPRDFAGICGIYWEGSGWYEALGAACATQDELASGRICPVYACARERGVTHCGLCPEFPCTLLVNLAAQRGAGDLRIESAAKRAEVGDEKWAQWARTQPRKIWIDAFCPLRNDPLNGRGGA